MEEQRKDYAQIVEYIKKNGSDIITLKEHLYEIIELRDKATQLQAVEYSRRLDALNHEAEQLKRMHSTYLPREIYDANHRGLESKIDNIQRLVYVGLGIVLGIQFLLKFFIK